MSQKVSLCCMSGKMLVVTAGRALLFETVNDMGEYHHNYFIHSSSLSTNNSLSVSLFKYHIPVLNFQGILDFHCQHVGIFDSYVCYKGSVLDNDGKVSQYEL